MKRPTTPAHGRTGAPRPGRRSHRQRALRGQAYRSHRGRWLALAALLGIGMGMAWGRLPAGLGAPTPRLMHVAVTGADRISAREIAAAAGVVRGAALASLDLGAVAGRVAAHPWVAAARVAVLAPGRLLVAVDERVPVAVARGAGDTAWLVDASGTPFARVRPGDMALAQRMPRVVGAEGLDPTRVHPALARAVDLAAEVRARELPRLRAVQVGGAPPEALPALEFETRAGPLRVILGPKASSDQLDRVVRVLAHDLAEVRAASELDVRFESQVVVRSDSAPEGAEDGPERGREGA